MSELDLPIPSLDLYFYNSETKHKELLKPQSGRSIKMYTCGPTVYNFAHIGNFRAYVVEDLVRRTLKFFGYHVHHVMNITDIDDKIIKGAMNNKVSIADFTSPFINAFFVDIQSLKIERAESYPLATDYVPHMIDFVQKLLDKGVAYKNKDGSVYFAIEKCPRYGRLSHLTLSELKVGDRVSLDEYDKENVGDFVLWKGYDPSRDGLIFWESPFGRGRPGWHLECSTMAHELLGETIDIHMGGVDNIFPHHENEIAQSEMCSGKCFVSLWMHVEHLLVDNKKMSKSLGNFYTLRDLLAKGYTGEQVRYLLMQTHYRTQLNFTLEALDGARNAVQRLSDFVIRLKEIAQKEAIPTPEVSALVQTTLQRFAESLANDLNCSVALATLFDFMRAINTRTLTAGDARYALYLLHALNRVLAILPLQDEEKIPPELLTLLKAREEARLAKDFATADQLRRRLEEAGYRLEDTPQGARLKKK